jgi:hypothetical protein
MTRTKFPSASWTLCLTSHTQYTLCRRFAIGNSALLNKSKHTVLAHVGGRDGDKPGFKPITIRTKMLTMTMMMMVIRKTGQQDDL